MTLKLGPIADDKPVKVSIDVPADIYRDLTAYAEAHAAETGLPSQGPTKLIVPMLAHFMADDREFAKLRRRSSG
ncbi:hypothetical protein COC42_12370 [Sphingomonas spermidinifaciens]|uniref:DUF2274 domain-containing protein n=1 Tax=Sphingomonas spermidinifaciens TaxID=1141889 RepID=A0A2A4AZ71_9SPHN|nr:DUF2274 domain-containing protein [Sphingomonas spermidinifaciens]PCD02243.1 hypothetical protein COC42_12370 [Sphingomonas spermidinifaciens]